MREPDPASSSVRPDQDPGWAQFIRSIGRNLLARRLAHGLTQQQAAEMIGIQPESVSRIENGVIIPTLFRLRQFSRAYDCSLASLLENASDQPGDLAARIVQELEGLDAVDRRFIASQLSALAGHLRHEAADKPQSKPSPRSHRALAPSAVHRRSPSSGR
jgi:transcriptional regulator with XRE-family HTH domain